MKPPFIAIILMTFIAQFRLHALPAITSGPTPSAMFVRVGSNVTFSITATGNITPLKLQWRLNGANIPGATNSTLAITNAQDKDHGTYTVLAIDAGGAVGSPRAVLFVDTNEVAQTGGVLNFASLAAGVDAPFINDTWCDGAPGQRAEDDYVAQLWVGPGGVSNPLFLKSTGPLALFRNGAQAGYFLDGPRFVPIAQPGDTVTVQVRVFEWRATLSRSWGFTWEDSWSRTETHLIQVQLGAPDSDVPNLVGISGGNAGDIVLATNQIQPSNITARLGDTVEFRTGHFAWDKDGAKPSIERNLIVRNVTLDDVGEYRIFDPCDGFGGNGGFVALTLLAVLFDPYFESATVTNGNFHALIGGSISNSLTIQSSADLTNWTPELTVTNLDGFLPFDRDISTNGPNRFFRLVWQ